MEGKAPCPHCGKLIDSAMQFCSYCGQAVSGSPPPDYYGTPLYAPPAAARRTPGWVIGCIVVGAIGAVVVVIGLMAAISLPNFIRIKENAKNAEVKQNLHAIQLAIERYAVDHDGSYPHYLIGGEPRAAAVADPARNDADAFQSILDCPSIDEAADPLLAGGYLTAYPHNPFVRSGVAIHQVQENLPSAEYDSCDPLRNGTPEGAQFGTRFGAQCDLMGAVLADPRYRRLDGGERTYADIEYEFWDVWAGNEPLPFLPGDFFYKSMGPAVSWDPRRSDLILPGEIDRYILGAYGGIRTQGKDILGEEQPVPSNALPIERGLGSIPPPGDFWYLTRSEVSDDPDKRDGSAYGFGPDAQGVETQSYGNPNGIRDALVLILSAGG